jgi:hypothetical protein
VKLQPEVNRSPMTGHWYLVTSWHKDGSARRKINITLQISEAIKEARAEIEQAVKERQEKIATTKVKPADAHAALTAHDAKVRDAALEEAASAIEKAARGCPDRRISCHADDGEVVRALRRAIPEEKP